MKIAIGNDHRGVEAKAHLAQLLRQQGHEVIDLGTGDRNQSVDYPDYAFTVSEQVASGRADRGILLCATGVGMSIAANKVSGVRAALCMDPVSAEMSRRHNDANVLCLAADLTTEDLMDRTTRTWLDTDFEGGRHARRVDKVGAYEKEHEKSK